jgi:hypothetical protein
MCSKKHEQSGGTKMQMLDESNMRVVGAAVATAALAGCATTDGRPVTIRPEIAAIRDYTYTASRESISVLKDMARSHSKKERKHLAAELTAFLGTDATLDAKQEACRILWTIAGEENVSGISKLLHDAKTADMARFALERLESSAVDRALVSALDSAPTAAKSGIINSLAARRTSGIVNRIKAFVSDSDPFVSESARSALKVLQT